MKTWISSVAAACLLASPAAFGALKVGDPAPKINVSKWAQGAEVKEMEGDKVYIVEFWATWCGPCKAAIPHLDEIYRKHKDEGLVVIGSDLGEDASKVTPFIKEMGGKMSYRVTVDAKDGDSGYMAKHWLEAADQKGIPCSFVVNKKGRIAYIGHPMQLPEELLEKLLAEPSEKAAEPVVVAQSGAPSTKQMDLIKRASAQMQEGKLDDAEATVAELQESLSPNLGYIAGVLEIELLVAKKDPDGALELSNALCEDYAKSPFALACVAEGLVSVVGSPAKLQAAAEKIATPISETGSENAKHRAFSALSRIATLKGDTARADELKKLAGTRDPQEY